MVEIIQSVLQTLEVSQTQNLESRQLFWNWNGDCYTSGEGMNFLLITVI